MFRLPEKITNALEFSPAWRWLTTVLVLTVCWLAFAPSDKVPTAFWDKLNHALAFAAMSFSARFAFPRAFWPSMLGLAAFGFFIEVVQYFLPGRASEWFDLLSDVVGIAVGAAIAAIARRFEGRA
jgi:VanZ family protein